jgi:hypothetical protein
MSRFGIRWLACPVRFAPEENAERDADRLAGEKGPDRRKKNGAEKRRGTETREKNGRHGACFLLQYKRSKHRAARFFLVS